MCGGVEVDVGVVFCLFFFPLFGFFGRAEVAGLGGRFLLRVRGWAQGCVVAQGPLRGWGCDGDGEGVAAAPAWLPAVTAGLACDGFGLR